MKSFTKAPRWARSSGKNGHTEGQSKNEGEDVRVTGRSVTIALDGAAAAVLMWVTSVAMMLWESFGPGAPGMLGRWSILFAMMALCWTLVLVIQHARRVVLEVMSYEFRVRDERESEGVVSIGRQR